MMQYQFSRMQRREKAPSGVNFSQPRKEAEARTFSRTLRNVVYSDHSSRATKRDALQLSGSQSASES
jgi:hypothetical protein